MSDKTYRCDKYIPDPDGLHIHLCGRPAIRSYQPTQGPIWYHCGLHSRNKNLPWVDLRSQMPKEKP